MSITLAPGALYIQEKGREPVYLGKTPNMVIVGASGSTNFISPEVATRRFFTAKLTTTFSMMQCARLAGMGCYPLRKSQKTQLRYERFQRNRRPCFR